MGVEVLRRCAAGEITPELALNDLLTHSAAEADIDGVLGAAIWDALERRERGSADRLAQVQKLWNCRQQQGIQDSVHPV